MARKNKKKSGKKFWAILFMVFALIGVVFYSQNFNLTGGTILSIDDAKYVSGGNEVNDGFLFDVVVNGGGESISGIIQPEDFAKYGTEKIPRAFKLEFSLSDVSCDYRVEYTNKSLFKIYQSTAVNRNLATNPPYSSVSLQTTQNWCNNGAPSGLPKSSPGLAPNGGDCSQMKEIGEWGYWSPEQSNALLSGRRQDNVGSLGDWRVTHVGGIPFYDVLDIGTRGFVKYNVNVKVTNENGDIIETVLDSKDKTALLGDYGRVKLVGNLLADELCEIPAIKYSIIENAEEKKFVEKSWVDTYFNNYRNLVGFDNDYFEFQWRQQRIDPGVGAEWIFGTISGMNNALNQLSLQDLDIGCSVVGSTVSCEPEGDVVYPEMQILLDSDYVGVSEDYKEEITKLKQDIQVLQEQLIQTTDEVEKATLTSKINGLKRQLENLESAVTPVIEITNNGMPQINTVNYEEIISNQIGIVSLSLTNVGEETDSFDVDLRCDKDISFGSKRISLIPDQTGNVDIRFNGDAGDYTCKIYVKSVNNPINADIEDVKITIKEKETPDSPEDLLESNSSNNSDSGNILVLVIVIVLVVGIMVYFVKNKNRERKSSKK